MIGIRAAGRGPHVSRIDRTGHAPITAFDPRARILGLGLCALIVLAFATWLVLR